MREPDDSPLAIVSLFAGTGVTRDFDAGPRMRIGRVRFGGWQVEPRPSERYIQDAYLVRVTFDILLAPGVPGPRWAEVGFAFRTAGVVVLDAVPRAGRSDQSRLYTLTSALNFTESPSRDPDEAVVPLDAEQAAVQVFGIADVEIRWRYTASGPEGVPPGTRTGWLVLLVPPGTPEVEVAPLAHYELADQRELECTTDARPRVVALRRQPDRSARPGAHGGYSGQQKLEFVRRLGSDWADVADLLEVPIHVQKRFEKGGEPRDLWNWLADRSRLGELPGALDAAGRTDLAAHLRTG